MAAKKKRKRRPRKSHPVPQQNVVDGIRQPTRDVDGRTALRGLEAIAKDRDRFIAWLDDNENDVEVLAKNVAKLKGSQDERVSYRATELEAKIRGLLDSTERKQAGPLAIVINVGEAKIVQPKDDD